jgi:DNA-binding SARP family transcriptional activator/Tfp pilus assembly protein PilF
VNADTKPVPYIEVLGPVRALRAGRELDLGPPRQRALLAMLALRVNQTVSRNELIDGLWGTDPPASVINRVHVHISALRQVFEPDRGVRAPSLLLASTGPGYRLALPPGHLDLETFGRRLAEARRFAAGGQLVEAVEEFRAALALWQGPALAGAPGPWAQTERARLTELRLTAVEEWAGALLALGRPGDVLTELAARIAEHPLRERLPALLMTALYRAGRPAEALAVYAETSHRLVEQLGVDPGPELQRLHQSILRGDPDTSPLTPRIPALPVRAVPAQLPLDVRGFTGRAAQLDALHSVVSGTARPPATVVISAVWGTAGVGKTALAVHWAHQVRDRFPDGQLYVNLRGFDPSGTAMHPAEAVRGFLDALDVPAQRVPTHFTAQAALYRSLLSDKRVLILLDNARDAEQVRPLLPGAPSCLVVVTSRNQLTDLVAGEGARPLPLDLLSTADARDLIKRRLGAERVAAEPAAVDEIITYCARLPLALAIVAARAATHPDLPLSALAGQLRDTHAGLDAFNAGDAATNVRAVFSWSYQTLRPATARLFRLLGLHPGTDLATPAAASLAGLPVAEVGPLLTELTRAHLLTEPTPGRYNSHDLLRAYATEQANLHEPAAERRAAVHRFLDHYLHTAHTAARLLEPYGDPIVPLPLQPGVSPEPLADDGPAMAWFTTEHANLLAMIQLAASQGFDGHAWRLAWTLSDFFDRRGHWYDWAATQQTAVEAAERAGDQRGQAYAHRHLAFAYIQAGRYEEADAHLRHALELFGVLDDLPGQARAYLGIGWLSERQGRPTDALHHAHQALERYRMAGQRSMQAGALNAIGWSHIQLGNHQEALRYCTQALRLHQESGDRAGEANTWDSLGYAYHRYGDQPQAVTCYQRALDLWRDLGDRHYEATTLTRLGDAYHALGVPAAAGTAWRQALAILEELDHPDADAVGAKLTAASQSARQSRA